MDFKHDFEKNLNKQLEAEFPEPPVHPPPPPPIHDYTTSQAPVQTFPCYPPRRSGIYIPTPLFILFVLVFLFESGVLFVYTVVALFNTLPVALIPGAVPACNCHDAPDQITPLNVAPNYWPPGTAVSTITATITVSDPASSSTESTTSHSTSILTVTGPIPTSTVLVTASAIPSITTETVFSTATPQRSTVTSIAFVTGRSVVDEEPELLA